ncbi:hypothetical protein [Rhodospirillum sp. A1_3_36]|uniref:hypothetical protein n=1 Tax=Rhodospirillum sp. A1_3_36 TaxID=3391666 RepID=UPI0039A6509C
MAKVIGLATWRKKGAGEDFTLNQVFGAMPPESVQSKSAAHLQVHINGEYNRSMVLFRHGETWFIQSMHRASGLDASGRFLHEAHLGTLDVVTPSAGWLIGLLVAVYRSNQLKAMRQEEGFASVSEVVASAQVGALAPLLEFIMGWVPFAQTDKLEKMAFFLEVLGPGLIDWLAVYPGHTPTRPAEGLGFVLSDGFWAPSTKVEDFISAHPEVATLDLSGLVRFVPPGREAERLIIAAVSRLEQRDGEALSGEAIAWVCATATGKANMLAHGLPEELTTMAKNDFLSDEDLRSTASRLPMEALDYIASRWFGTEGGLERFFALFGNRSPAHLARLLPPGARAALDVLRGGQWSSATHLVPHLPLLFEMGLLPSSLPPGPTLVLVIALPPDMENLALMLLEVAGFPRPEFVWAFLSDPSWVTRWRALTPSEEDTAALSMVAKTARDADVDLVARVITAVMVGFPLSLLVDSGLSDAVVALLSPDAVPPLQPPPSWRDDLAPLLSGRVEQEWFWRRWEPSMPQAMVDWLGRVALSSEGRSLAATLSLALDDRITLNPEQSKRLIPVLPESVLYQQVMRQAFAVGGETAIRPFLRAAKFPPALARWLEGELLSPLPNGPPPSLSVDAMIAFLPLLHPVRDVVRPLLAREEVDAGERRLIAPLLEALRRLSPIPPPVRPSRMDGRRHSELIEALATLPGWAHWMEVSDV